MTAIVLVVEEEAEVRSLVQATLEWADYWVASAEDGPKEMGFFYEARPDPGLLRIWGYWT